MDKPVRFTIPAIRKANEAAGFFFFSEGSMSFFDSRIETVAHQGKGGVFFVTSEQFDEGSPRYYNVRQFIPEDGRVIPVEPHMQMTDRSEAVALAISKAAGR